MPVQSLQAALALCIVFARNSCLVSSTLSSDFRSVLKTIMKKIVPPVKPGISSGDKISFCCGCHLGWLVGFWWEGRLCVCVGFVCFFVCFFPNRHFNGTLFSVFQAYIRVSF